MEVHLEHRVLDADIDNKALSWHQGKAAKVFWPQPAPIDASIPDHSTLLVSDVNVEGNICWGLVLSCFTCKDDVKSVQSTGQSCVDSYRAARATITRLQTIKCTCHHLTGHAILGKQHTFVMQGHAEPCSGRQWFGRWAARQNFIMKCTG